MGWKSCEVEEECAEEMKINFVDLKRQYLTIKGEIDSAIAEVIESTAFTSGPFVKTFEDNFAKFHNAKYCVGVNSGTSALHVVMWALGIGSGDEVIVPTNSFFATAESVSLCGATPVFVDCEPEYYNIDPSGIEGAITERTKALIPVHLYGQPAEMDKIKELADKHRLILIEDCAQAHMADYKGRKVGTFGVAGCFSFYPGKNLGAYGEAGAVTTNDEELYKKMLILRDHGASKKYYHDYVGHNYRMEGIQGAILNVKLKYLEEWTEKRRRNAGLYARCLSGIKDVCLPKEMDDIRHVYHLYVIRVPRRDELMKYLNDNDISTGVHYPVPCHRQKAYDLSCRPGKELPVSERYAGELLSLPMYPELTEEEVLYVCKIIETFYKG